MFETSTNLDVDLHKDLRFEPSINLKFAATTSSAPIVASEITQVIRQFPVVFSKDDEMVPIAFMSLTEGKNAFISETGTWEGDYLPAHIRRFPFILGKTDDPEKYTIMFDSEAPEINTTSGERLYKDDGDMAPALQQAVDLLQAFQSELVATQKLIEPLVEKDVLTDQVISVNRPDGRNWTLNGVRAVDGERLKALDDATLAAWTRSGLMAIVYAHLHSLENVRYLAERQGILNTEV